MGERAKVQALNYVRNNFLCEFSYLYINIFTMTISDLKLKIFRQIDSLEKSRLEEFYGLMMNYLNSKRDLNDWEKLSKAQKKGIFDAIDEIESGKGEANKAILGKFRKKYSNA